VKGSSRLDELCINTVRTLSIDAVQRANSGHPGLPMGAAPMAYVLWTKFLRHNPRNPQWPGRDRFILSAGHGSMLLYSLLYLTGYDLPLEELKNFRQWGSRTPGHPEHGLTPGVEATTGPLGQGFGCGVGMAIAANKVRGARAALCHDEYTARLARRHNDANVLSLGARVVATELALDIVDVFMRTPFDGGRHVARITELAAIEEEEAAAVGGRSGEESSPGADTPPAPAEAGPPT